MTTPENLFEVGATYVVQKDDLRLRDHFERGQVMLYWRHGYSRYDGMHGWFFFDEQQKIRAWDLPEHDDYQTVARSTFELKSRPHPLLLACKVGDEAGARRALSDGIPLAGAKHLAFELACKARSYECVALLLESADVRSQERNVFLHHAASEGFTAAVRLLLDAQANVNDTDGSGQTALLHAACGGHLETIELLLARGADPTLRNDSGTSIIELARAWKQHAAVKRLQQALAKRS